eukprot:GILI01001554.1.p1 GENE.GILI01001554.1~~GILI01001554.1.p1  ORF type:complete len:2075 (+),score=684.51 GILI01001554.1:415-6225(+)
MGPPGGGRTFITPRMLRHFNVVAFASFDDETMVRIFTTIMDWSFGNNNFSADILGFTKKLVVGTMDMYKIAMAELRPTPLKSHYVFNLRDFARVIMGILLIGKDQADSQEKMVRLWSHEIFRVFGDRLIDETDRHWLLNTVRDLVKKNFAMSFDQIFKHLDMNKDGKVDTLDEVRRIFFGDYMTPPAAPKRPYDEVQDFSVLQQTIEGYLDQYNAMSTKPMNLVMFSFAIEHLSRICRVLKQPGGNALLVGVGGSGRQSLTRLASYMADYELFQIEISKSYGKTEWREDLKKLLRKAGGQGISTVFLFTDSQIKDESFVEDINNLLNSGEVPNLYPADEKAQIIELVRPFARQEGKCPDGTPNQLYNYFIERCKKMLHIVLCFSPIGGAFRNRLRMFPSLVNCCTIDWFTEWPEEALLSVARGFMVEQDLQLGDSLEGLVKLFTVIHTSVENTSKRFLAELRRRNYVTPTSYLELLTVFRVLLAEKRQEVGTLKNRLQGGLDKLMHAAEQVAEMQVELKEKQPVLAQTQKDVERMMEQIAVDKEKADETKQVVAREEADATQKAAETKAIADDAQRDLDEALPALEAAVECLNKLKQEHVREVKAMANPPNGVKLTMEAVCIMQNVKPVKKNDPTKPGVKFDDYWEAAQTNLLKDPVKFLQSLTLFDKDNIPEATIKKIEPYMVREDFEPSRVKSASVACEAICMWVRAMFKYYHVAKNVEPKREALRQAQAELDVTMRSLNDAKARLREVENRIQQLENDYDREVAAKDALQRDIEDCQVKLDRAQKLIGGLGGEKDRWTDTVTKLSHRYSLLPGDCIVSAGMVAYGGPFTASYRAEMEQLWRTALEKQGIEATEHVTMRHVLGDAVKIRAWNIAGLPNDSLSIENGIIMDKSRRWPLMIDPQGQANRWIKNMGRDTEAGVEVCKLSDPNFLRTLELGIQFGKWILLENVNEELDPALEPVLLQQKIKQGGSYVIKLGDKTVNYNESFKFFLTTKLPNPHYSPETSVKVTLLNFAITPQGLEEQMLAQVVALESPELEQKKNTLVVSNAKMRKELKDIEDKILYLLSNSQGNILDDEELINTLAASKKTSEEINQKVKEAEETEKEIDAARESYRPVAFRSSLLFFCIVDLSTIDPMYQYSLQWFSNLFSMGIENAPSSSDLNQRLLNLNDYFTYSLYENVCRSLFEKHKLLLSLQICVRILQSEKKINNDEWNFFLRGGQVLDKNMQPKNPTDWLSAQAWDNITCTDNLPSMKGLVSHFEQNVIEWKRWFVAPEPEKESLPGEWESKLDGLQKMIVLRCLRPDRVVFSATTYVSSQIGSQFVDPPPFDLEKIFDDSTNTTPLIFVLSPGVDPMTLLNQLAVSKGQRVDFISLGQGQAEKAEKMLLAGAQQGFWVFLANCHLSISWMPALEKLIEKVVKDGPHQKFRLWLSSDPHPKFPISILQRSIKMTTEPPKGLKANLLRLYNNMQEEQFTRVKEVSKYKKLLFSLCWFHSILIERRKFKTLGWNVPYDFNDSDFSVCENILAMYLDQYPEKTPWDAIKYLIAEANYGGRVTDDWDRRCLMSILGKFITPDILEEGYVFSDSGLYRAPPDGKISQYRSYVDGLPISDGPEIFGMHENANITFQQKEAKNFMDTVISIQPRLSGGSGGKSPDEIAFDLASDIQRRLPPSLNKKKAHTNTFALTSDGTMNSLGVFISQEIDRFNNLVRVISKSLKDLKDAIKGLVVMSADLEKMYNCFLFQKVPENWEEVAYPSLKPLATWMRDLIQRIQQLMNWAYEGQPRVFWLSGFTYPTGFLTAVLQASARKNGVSIDSLTWEFAVYQQEEATILQHPKEGAYIKGLFIEGARWNFDNSCLSEPNLMELFSPMPIIHFKPVDNKKKSAKGCYACPLYMYPIRTGTRERPSYMITVDLKSGNYDPEFWVRRGTALLLSLAS